MQERAAATSACFACAADWQIGGQIEGASIMRGKGFALDFRLVFVLNSDRKNDYTQKGTRHNAHSSLLPVAASSRFPVAA